MRLQVTVSPWHSQLYGGQILFWVLVVANYLGNLNAIFIKQPRYASQ